MDMTYDLDDNYDAYETNDFADLEALKNFEELSAKEDRKAYEKWEKHLDEAWAKRDHDEIIANLVDCAELLFHHADELSSEQKDQVIQVADFLSCLKE